MEKNIIWNEFKVKGIPNNYQIEYKDILFTSDSVGFLFLNDNSDNTSYEKIKNSVYSTIDGGYNWKQIYSNYGEGVNIKRFNNTLLILQTIHPKDYREDKHSNICISNNLGENWCKKIELPFQLHKIELITDKYWIGSYRDTIFYTHDAGITWIKHKISMPKTDNRLFIITHNGDIYYMSYNQIIQENIELKTNKVVTKLPDDQQYYCDEYVFNKNIGLFLIISDSNFTNCKLYSITNNTIQIPSNDHIGIISMSICENKIIINGYRIHSGGLSNSVFFYKKNNETNWEYKDFDIGYLPYPVTFFNDEIIAYCHKNNTIIRTAIK